MFSGISILYVKGKMSHVMSISDFCIPENKGTDQLRSNCAADQRLYIRYIDSIKPLLSNSVFSQASSHFLWFK